MEEEQPNLNLEDFPDDIIGHIFSRCSVQTLVRLKAVSKKCKSLIEEPGFKIRYVLTYAKRDLFYLDADNVYSYPAVEDVSDPFPQRLYFAGCTGGMICLLDMKQGEYYLLNPHLRGPPITMVYRPKYMNTIEFSRLGNLKHGLIYHDQQYELLVFSTYYKDESTSFPYWVFNFNLNTAKLWYHKGRPPQQIIQSDAAVIKGIPYWAHSSVRDRRCAFHRGGEQGLVYFDQQEFKYMRIPESIGVLQGVANVMDRLTIATSRYKIDIWCFEADSSWSKMYALPIPYDVKFYFYPNRRLLRHMRRFRPVDLAENNFFVVKGGCIASYDIASSKDDVELHFLDKEVYYDNRLISCQSTIISPGELRDPSHQTGI